jgi:hypothetical protein
MLLIFASQSSNNTTEKVVGEAYMSSCSFKKLQNIY